MWILGVSVARALCWVLALAACHGQARAEGETVQLSRPLVVRWSYQTRGITSQTPASYADALYVPLEGGVLAAISPQDGQLLWRSETGGEFSADPAADERGVYVSSELRAEGADASTVYTKGVVRALSRTTGVALWTRTVPTPPAGALVLGGEMLYGASPDGRIYALDKGTGAPVWIVKTEHSFRSAPSVAEGRLTLASEDGQLLFIEPRTGTTLRRYRTGGAQAAPFAVRGKITYAGSADGYVTAFRDAGGRLETVWRRRAGTSVQTLTATPAGLLVASRDNFVYFLSHRRGDRVWKKQLPDRVVGPPLVGSDSALFALLGGEVCVALSLADGKQVNTLPLGEGNSASTPPRLASSYVIVPTRNGLLAFAPSEASR